MLRNIHCGVYNIVYTDNGGSGVTYYHADVYNGSTLFDQMGGYVYSPSATYGNKYTSGLSLSMKVWIVDNAGNKSAVKTLSVRMP